MQQLVQLPGGKRFGFGAQQASRRGIGKAHFALAIQSANAVGDGIEENLLLPPQVVGTAAFLGSRQHLPQ